MGGVDDFARAVARVAVAQLLSSAGFEGAPRSVIDALADVAVRYISHIGAEARFQANLAGRSEANVFDIIAALEELVSWDGLLARSSSHQCLVGSRIVKQLGRSVGAGGEDEVPYAKPIPRFPVRKMMKIPQSFERLRIDSGRKHIPTWLPVFPEPHTYIRTEVWSEKPKDSTVAKVEQVRQRRKAEKSLLNLHQRLARGGDSVDVATNIASTSNQNAVPGNQVVIGSNPFLAPPLPYGGAEVSEIDPPKETLERRDVSVLEAFAPAISLAESGNFGGSFNSNIVLPRERAPVKFGIDRNSVVAALSSKSFDAKRSSYFVKGNEKDDKKRRAEMILKEAMENPLELAQL